MQKKIWHLLVSLFLLMSAGCSGSPTQPFPSPTTEPIKNPPRNENDLAAATASASTGTTDLPASDASGYRLIGLDEAAAWTSLQSLPSALLDYGEGSSAGDHGTARLTLLREFIARFPESPHLPDARRQIAELSIAKYIGWSYMETIAVPTGSSIEPFRQLFEQALNAGAVIGINQESLETIIGVDLQIGVSAVQVLPIENLFEDGQTGWIIEIRVVDVGVMAASGAVFVLGGNPGAYHLHSISEDWTVFQWSDQTISSEDLNRNGVPEILVQYSGWGMGMTHICEEEIHAYEWDGTRFVDLTPGISIYAGTLTSTCLEFVSLPNPNGPMTVVSRIAINTTCHFGDYSLLGTLIRKKEYEWNGSYFSLVRESVEAPMLETIDGSSIGPCLLTWVNEAGPTNQTAYQLLPEILSETDPDRITEYEEEFGPAYLDFFTYKLATWHAMHGRRGQALSLLDEVISRPHNPDYSTASDLAQAFLDGYGSGNAYSGCVAANHVLDFCSFPETDFLDTEEMRAEWGFADPIWFSLSTYAQFSGPGGRDDPVNVCSLSAAFHLAIQDRSFTSTDQVARWLHDENIPYSMLESGDVDVNLRPDWFVLVGTGRAQRDELWLLFNQGGSILPLRMDVLYSEDTPLSAWAQFSPEPGGRPVNVLIVADQIYVFRTADAGPGNGIAILDQETGNFHGYDIQPTDYGDELTLYLGSEYWWDQDWVTLGWDPISRTLVRTDSPYMQQERQISHVEGLIFESGEYETAISILTRLIEEDRPSIDEDPNLGVDPYLHYLLGLAYELNGDADLAVNAYWTLWNDYPTHPFVSILRRKLTLRSP